MLRESIKNDVCDRFGCVPSHVVCHGCFYNKKNVCNYAAIFVKPKSLNDVIKEMKKYKNRKHILYIGVMMYEFTTMFHLHHSNNI